MKKSIRKIKKDLKKGVDIDISRLRLSGLPLPLRIILSEFSGLVQDKFKAGDVIVSINSGEMIELSGDYINGATKIEYKQIWEWCGPKYGYSREYDDDYGGTLHLGSCDLLFPADKLWKSYDHVYRLATKAELDSRN